jgi:AbiV family abortive infection protein
MRLVNKIIFILLYSNIFMDKNHDNFVFAREKIILNSWELLKTAIFLFEKNQYSVSCFLAMTSIEETGKLIALRELDVLNFEYITPKSRNKFFRDHRKKAIQASGAFLYINNEADERHGIDPTSKIHRTAGVFLLALSLKWMEIRNKCLYTDINFTSKTASAPRDSISRDHAYYFICMGLEILSFNSLVEFSPKFVASDSLFMKTILEFCIELFNKDYDKFDKNEIIYPMKDWKTFTDHNKIPEELTAPWNDFYKTIQDDFDLDQIIDKKAIEFKKNRLSDLKKFMDKWSNTVDLNNLDFLSNPDPLLKLIKDREGTENLYLCIIKYLTLFEVNEKHKLSRDNLVELNKILNKEK